MGGSLDVPKLHTIGDVPRVLELADGHMRFVVSNEFVAFGIEGAPLFATEGESPGRISAQLADSDGSPLDDGEWSPDVRFLPVWVELDLAGRDEPDLHCRVELRDSVPRLVELAFRARTHQGEVRQKHLREIELAELVNTIYRQWIVEVRDVWRDTAGGTGIPTIGDEQQQRVIRSLVHDMRGRRRVTAELLKQVAEIYRANFDQAPVEAVARTFGVKPRMAHEYVRRARDRGFLPPTTQGKKKA